LADSVTYKHIPVKISPGQEQEFDFEIGENEEWGQFAKITSEGHELIIDEDLAYLKGDMPVEWRQPAVEKLLLLLKANEHQDGMLS